MKKRYILLIFLLLLSINIRSEESNDSDYSNYIEYYDEDQEYFIRLPREGFDYKDYEKKYILGKHSNRDVKISIREINARTMGLETLYNRKVKMYGKSITYSVLRNKKNFFVISYLRNHKGIYERYTYDRDRNVFIVMRTIFDVKNKNYVQGFITILSRSFKLEKGGYYSEPSVPVSYGQYDYNDDIATLQTTYREVMINGNLDYLARFTYDELSLIRNTLFAYKGYEFRKGKYRDYFTSKTWYYPTTREVELNKNEKQFLEYIKYYEGR